MKNINTDQTILKKTTTKYIKTKYFPLQNILTRPIKFNVNIKKTSQ